MILPATSDGVSETLSLEHVARERQRFDHLRRMVFIVAGVLGVLLIVQNTIELIFTPSSMNQPVLYIVNNVAFGVFAAIVVVLSLLRRVPQETLEQWTLVVFAFESLLFNGIAPAITEPSLQLLFDNTVGDDIWFLLIICAFILHIFPAKTAFWMSLGMYGVSSLIMLYRLWPWLQYDTSNQSTIIIRSYVFGAVILIFIYLLALYRDNLRQMRTQHELLEQLAFVDPLTQLANRRRMYAVLEERLTKAQTFSVLLCDIDYFKQVNDRFGHDVGDQVLQQVAHVLRDNIRTSDSAGRWGGEEFLLVLPNTNLTEASLTAERLCQAITAMVQLEDFTVTLSIGAAEYLHRDTSDQLIKRADRALYVAKQTGRNRVSSHTQAAVTING
jgi:diguanylate cyclase (GGDEF)-like protein